MNNEERLKIEEIKEAEKQSKVKLAGALVNGFIAIVSISTVFMNNKISNGEILSNGLIGFVGAYAWTSSVGNALNYLDERKKLKQKIKSLKG